MTARITDWINGIKNWTLPKLGRLRKASVPVSQEERLTKSLGRFEPYVFQIQSILVWENPLLSALSVLGANFIFWFVVNYDCRFFGVLLSSILMFYLYEMWTEHIWPEISIPAPVKAETEEWKPQHPSGVLSVPEISGYLVEIGNLMKSYCIYLKTLREEQPGIFCCEMCGVFGALFFIGRTVSGMTIAYCLLMFVMIGPGIFIHILPPATVNRIATVLRNFRAHRLKETDSEVEDMLPEATRENLSLFDMAGDMDVSSEKDETNDFTFDAALSEMTGSLPESSLDDLDDLELNPVPHPPPRQRRNGSPSDSDDSSNEAGIHFRSSHFNGDTSSEEESAFTQGLTFTDSPQPAAQPPAQTSAQIGSAMMSGLAQNLTTLGSSLITSVMSRAMPAPEHRPPRTSSSDSDEFEIIEKEEIS